MARFDVATFGEGGLRLGVPAGKRLQNASRFDVHVAGAEANVAATLSRLGRNTAWLSCLAETPPGQRVAHTLRGAGVDLSGVVWKPDVRTGIYFIEHAQPPRPTKVFYDRDDTGTARLTESELDWDLLLDARAIHLTGITAGLSPSCLEIVAKGLREGRAHGVMTSFDVNFRRLLWKPDEAAKALGPMLSDVDLLFCNRRDAESVLGCAGTSGEIARQLAERTGAGHVVMSNGATGVTAFDGSDIFEEPTRETTILDRTGAGDALVSGVLHGLLDGDFPRGLVYGQTLAAMAMSQFGDRVITTADELREIADGTDSDIHR